MATLTLRGVKKVYPGGVEAVKGVDLDVADGEMIVLVGPSGCGKSTLLRMVAGLETVTEGDLEIGGVRVNDKEPKDRDIAMVFQNYALYPHMSVYDNFAYGLRNQRMPKDEIARRVEKAAEMLELAPMLKRKPSQLSGGQRQRVAMGRAIVREPSVFLFDEPLSNLDAKLRVQMRVELKNLQRELATTALYVTHDQLEAMTLGDRLVVLNGGAVEQIGRPRDVYARPASVFVAEFTGSPAMNVLPAAALAPHLGGPVPAGAAHIGIRAEDLVPAPAGAPALLLSVRLVEHVGAEAHVHAALDGAGKLLVAALPARDAPEPGARLALAPRPGAVHFFDAEGRRIGDAAP